MNAKKLILFVLILVLNTSISAQKTALYTHSLKEFNEALALFNDHQYIASQHLFQVAKDKATDEETKATATYYIAYAAVKLGNKNADKMMQDFVKKYPTSTLRNSAFQDVADYYFENGKYSYALKWFEKINDNQLSAKERARFRFNKAYVYFVTKKYDKAKPLFEQLTSDKEFGSQAKYYIGYMAYQKDDMEEASNYFDQLTNNENYQANLPYYQADMSFKSGKFEQAIQQAKKLINQSDAKQKSELSKIIGESYFNLEKYTEATPFLKAYKGKRGKWNNTDFYQLGYAYYKQGDFANAVANFNKIINADNAVAQNAYYHLAESYLKLEKKQEALNAFKNASQMDYTPKIQEDAYYNYAKLSYEIGNPYKSVPQVILDYQNQYPKSKHKAELKELLISAYITSKNYKDALIALENSSNPNHKNIYQKVAFYRGIELFNDGKYNDAAAFFDKSLKYPLDSNFAAKAHYWKGESVYRLHNYVNAAKAFEIFYAMPEAKNLEEYKNIDYNLAYSYFKQKEYGKAKNFFNNAIDTYSDDAVRLNDSYLRLADTYFIKSDFNNALKTYDKALKLNGRDADYAQYQKAITYAFVGKNNKKISELNAFLNKYTYSKLQDDALFELGNAYVKANKNSKALSTYQRLVTNFKTSSYVPKALLKKGLIYYNEDKNEQALDEFKKIAAQFPNTDEAREAVANAKRIYVDLGRVDEYATWVRSLDYVAVSDNELEDASYESAEQKYQEANYTAAVTAFKSYLNTYNNGAYTLKAHFYLAEALHNTNKKNQAEAHYKYTIGQSKNEFTESALSRLASYYLEQKDWNKAMPILERLEQEADFQQNITFAQSNLMKGYYKLKNYNNAVAYAEKVLANDKIDNNVKSDAKVIIARSAIKTNDLVKAKTAYATLMTTATGELAAEAHYYDAFFKHQDGRYDDSNTAVQKLAKDYSAYKYWGAKGLIIMAKNFYAKDDVFQATYVLENVIKNFKKYPDVVAEAQTELDTINAKEAKRNASVGK
jgi:TolA-binding protein